jgi:hypothetical protein
VISIKDDDILFLHSCLDHEDLKIILDLVNYPEDHDGKIVFIKEIKGEALGPFTKAGKFYFNDSGEWYTMDEKHGR